MSDWAVPGVEEIAEASDALSLGLSSETATQFAALAPAFRAVHERAAERWRTQRSDPRMAHVVPGSDPWGATAYEVNVPGSPSGHLQGMTLAVKETIGIAGVPMECGSALLRGHVPRREATVIGRARAAGVTTTHIGRCDDLALAASGDQHYAGPVLNPWNPAHTTWGSSSGAAALVAAGEVDAAILVDQAGSARAPAAGCGLVSLLPTAGLIPLTGIFQFYPVMDRVGVAAHRTRTVADLASVLTGADRHDRLQGAECRPQDWATGLDSDVTGLRVGIVTESLEEEVCDPAVAELVRDRARQLAQEGARVREVSIPDYLLATDVTLLLTVHGGVPALLATSGGSSPTTTAADPDLAALLAAARRSHPEELAATVRLSASTAGHDGGQPPGWWLAVAHALMPQVAAAITGLMLDEDGFDALLTPTVPRTSPRLPDTMPPEQVLMRALSGITHTCAANLTGLPAIQVPAGLVDGLPVGVQLIGLPMSEQLLLGCALALEPTDGFPRPDVRSTS